MLALKGFLPVFRVSGRRLRVSGPWAPVAAPFLRKYSRADIPVQPFLCEHSHQLLNPSVRSERKLVCLPTDMCICQPSSEHVLRHSWFLRPRGLPRKEHGPLYIWGPYIYSVPIYRASIYTSIYRGSIYWAPIYGTLYIGPLYLYIYIYK